MAFDRRSRVALVLAAFVLGPGAASGGELAHFQPPVPSVRDFLVPAPGVYYLQYNDYYDARTLRNSAGESVDSFQGPRGRTVGVEPKVTAFALIPTLIYVSDLEFLGIHPAAYVSIPFSNPSAQIALQTLTVFDVQLQDSSFGLGDAFFQPFWLGRSWTYADAALGYGFYAPTGRYSAGANDNIGLGFWTHQLQAAAAYYPFENRATAVTAAFTYEINTKVEGQDIRAGDRATLNYGVSQYLPLTADQHWLVELAVAGYAQWEVTRDQGDDVPGFSSRDRILGIGPQIGLIQVPWKASLILRWQHEFDARGRFEGNWYGITLAKGF